MTKARTNADNVAGDISGVTAGTGLTGGGTSGTVTLTNDMATAIDAKGDLVVGTGADTYVRLAAGTNEQRVVANSATTSGLAYVADTTNYAIGAKGDLLVGTAADTLINVPVGTNNQVLTADSATTSGVKWATADALPSQTSNSGKYLTTNGTTASWAETGATNWIQRSSVVGVAYNKVEYNGTNLWVAVGNNGALYTSSDAITWTSRTSGFGSNGINSVAFGNGLWVAVGANGTLTTSTDGTTWTARTSNMSTNEINSVIYANSTWVAVGDGGGTTNNGGIIYSTDGITWTRKSQTPAVGTAYYDVIWNGTNWIVACSLSTNNYLYASTPSGTWTAGYSGTSWEISRIFWTGTRHVSMERSPYNSFYYGSSSTTYGTSTAYGFSPNTYGPKQGRAYFYNGKIYCQNGVCYNVFTPGATTMQLDVPNRFIPGRTTMTGSGTAYFEENYSAIWAGSQGLIIATYLGIYTTF